MASVAVRRGIGLVLAVLVFWADQAIKYWVVDDLRLPDIGQIEIVSFFNLTWMQNFGVSLGLFTTGSMEGRWALVAMTGAIALFVLVWLLRERKLVDIAALALVLGGAAGNIRDRMMRGYVVDYADLHFGDWRPFLIFNLADVAITFGVLIILARSLLSRDKPETEQTGTAPDPMADAPTNAS